MKISVQTDNLSALREVVASRCDEVRFGPEFCEWKIPSLSELKEAYSLASQEKKEFRYVTPRVSSKTLEELRGHLSLLDKNSATSIVVNDLGMLSILGEYPNLRPHLGRQLIFIPGRCPWEEIVQQPAGFLAKRKTESLFEQTSMNHLPTINFFKEYNVKDIDVDWITSSFPHLSFLVKNGLSPYVHLHLIPAAVTRKCHTARFLGEKIPEKCSKPCDSKAFRLNNADLGLELFLHGNVVFRSVASSKDDLKKLRESKAAGIVVSINTLERAKSRDEIDALIKDYRM